MQPEPFTEQDTSQLAELKPEGWTDIISAFRYYIQSPFCRPVKVVVGNRIVGIGTAILFGATAWLAHVIVHPSYRKRGVGGAIVSYLLDDCLAVPCHTVSLTATDLGYPVYLKVGFRVQTEYLCLERNAPLKCRAKASVVRYTAADAGAVLALDRVVSGEIRHELLDDQMASAFVYKSDGQLSGCYFPDLREGLIIADTAAAGIELMKVRYAAQCSGMLPVDNVEGVRFLKAKGFVEKKRIVRMIYGKGFPWQPQKLFNRIGGSYG